MKQALRDYFDEQVEWVLSRFPDRVHQLLDVVPMYVEDYPSPRVMKEMGVRRRSDLCGYYAGIPLPERHIEHSGTLSDAIYLYRAGILSLACDEDGEIDEDEFQHQIRVTILHELGHHHGMTEEELDALGYE